MASVLKIKLGIACVSAFFVILAPLLQTKFFASATIKKWGKLSWEDFQGIPRPFSAYDASISSSIYLEYDSGKGRYVAYAGQNNVRSWARGDMTMQDYLLRHEQYHFNITELHARMLNDYIEENPDGTLYLYQLRLNSIRLDLGRMQSQYDDETQHSLVGAGQRRWEVRIDSLLGQHHSWVTDHFSGAQVYLTPSDSAKGILADGRAFRQYVEYKYEMELRLTSYQQADANHSFQAQDFKSKILDRFEHVRGLTLDTAETVRVFVIFDDSAHTYYKLWVANDSYLYHVSARYPNTGDTTVYSNIASTFINSFRIVNTDCYWIAKLDTMDTPIHSSTLSTVSAKDEKEDNEHCLAIGPASERGFYRGPFYRDDGAMLFAYDPVIHPDSLRFQDILVLNEDLYSNGWVSKDQIFLIPADRIPKGKFTVNLGYTLLQDSMKSCYPFYYERLEVTRKR